jgi:hypothetical protein
VYVHAVYVFLAVASNVVSRDALVRSILTGYITELTADAQLGMNFSDDFII